MIKFSVILPVYNVEKYIEKCLNSIINQSYQNFELLIIDDETEDSSIDLAEKILKKFNGEYSIFTQKNRGLGGARNTGIELASGDYLVFIDSDDYITEDYLDIINRKIMESAAEIILFNSIIVNEGGVKTGEIKYSSFEEPVFTLNKYKQLLVLSNAAWNKVYAKKLFVENGIRYPEKLISEDLATTGKLLLKAKSITHVNCELYNYVVRENSITTTTNFSHHTEIIQAFLILESYFEKQGVIDEYMYELEFLAVANILLTQVVLINKIDYKENRQNELIDFVCEKYTRFWSNIYVKKLTFRQKITLFFISRRWLFLLNLLITNRRI